MTRIVRTRGDSKGQREDNGVAVADAMDAIEGGRKLAGIQSLEIGLSLAAGLMEAGTPLSLTGLARRAGMSTSKARAYMISLVRSGLVHQLGDGGLYDLGPLAIRLGLAAMSRVDVLRIARQHLPALQARVGYTVCICTWGDYGPVVIDKLDAPHHNPFEVRIGSTVQLLTTATGHVFLAWLAAERYAAVVQREREAGVHSEAHPKNINALVARIRKAGYAEVSDLTLPGFSAIAVPLLDYRGELVGSVNVVVASRRPRSPTDEKLAEILKEFSSEVLQESGG